MDSRGSNHVDVLKRSHRKIAGQELGSRSDKKVRSSHADVLTRRQGKIAGQKLRRRSDKQVR